jgi:glycosyltransferase involved in cell wall biosynthesis
MKRIAFISEHASPLATVGGVDAGGQNVYVAELAKQLAARKYRIDIFTRWEDPGLEQTIEWFPNVRVIHIKAGPIQYVPKEGLLPFMEQFSTGMLEFMSTGQIHYELIHANFWMSAMVAMEVGRRLNIPYVITFHALGKVRKLHQQEADRFPPERVVIEEETARNATRLIAECPQDRDDLIHLYNISEEQITIIPCGYNPTEFFPVDKTFARTLLRLEQDEHILLQLGRMVPRKGVDNAIRALRLLDNMKRKVRLLVVGGEAENPDPSCCPEIARLTTLARDEGVADQVDFTGRKNRNMLKYYFSAADIFVTTPWYEPFGITPLESMACGTPVIGSNVGGIRYSVKDGVTGFLVPPKDPEALAERIRFLLANPLLIRKMRTSGIHRVQREFTWQRIAESMDDLYESILHGDVQRSAAPVIHMNTGTDTLLFSEGI